MKSEVIYDLLVAGGGPAGIATATAAARNGIKVLLVEKQGYLGGAATHASVPAFCPFSDGINPIIGGIGLEVLQAMKEECFEVPLRMPENEVLGLDWVAIDPEVLKRVLDRIVVASGCQILFHTVMTGVDINEKNEVRAVHVYNKGGFQTIQAKYFADCTGDADLVAMAGGSFEYGDEQGAVQAGTLCFRVAGIDKERLQAYYKQSGENGNLDIAVAKARADGQFPLDENNVAGFVWQQDGIAGLNFGHLYNIKPLDAYDLTRAEIEARQKLPQLMTFLKKYVPGAENAVLVSSGPAVGIRESRRIIGETYLTKDSYNTRQVYPDTIARYCYPIDMHAATVEQINFGEQWDLNTSKYKPGEYYTIPFGCMLPQKLENVIVAGKNISSDRTMMSSLRVMPACFATGHAAGTATALCVKNNVGFRLLDVGLLQAQLRLEGAIV